MQSIFDLSALYLLYFGFEKVTTVTRGDNSYLGRSVLARLVHILSQPKRRTEVGLKLITNKAIELSPLTTTPSLV